MAKEIREISLALKQSLESIHPLAPWFVLTGAIWWAVLIVRTHFPELWEKLEKLGPKDKRASRVFQALPSVVIGAAVAASASGANIEDAILGAVTGALAPVWHHSLKAMSRG